MRDNTKYMNVYIQNDLYANKDLYQSGVARYPDSYMSSVNTARVVYNGRYIFNAAGTVASNEFSDTFTHEFGHWLNLQHTFNVLCSTANPVMMGMELRTPCRKILLPDWDVTLVTIVLDKK